MIVLNALISKGILVANNDDHPSISEIKPCQNRKEIETSTKRGDINYSSICKCVNKFILFFILLDFVFGKGNN